MDDEPVHPAGNGWAYSDTDYLVLGMIIEKICGNSYYDELSKRILQPLKLKNTSPSNSRILEGLVSGYTGEGPPFYFPEEVLINGVYVVNPQFEWTGGGLITNSLDFAKWAYDLYAGDVLPEKWKKEMLDAVNYSTGQPDSTGYGLGAQIWHSQFGYIYGHGGIFPGYQTQIGYIPDLACAVALQVNADRLSDKLEKSPYEYILELLPVIQQ